VLASKPLSEQALRLPDGRCAVAPSAAAGRSPLASLLCDPLLDGARLAARRTAAAILTETKRTGEDLPARMTGPMPVEMTFAIVGLPAADGAAHAPLIRDLARKIVANGSSAVALDEAGPAYALIDYVGDALLQRLDHPRADLLWVVVADWDDDRTVSLERVAESVTADLVRASATASGAFATLSTILVEPASDPGVADWAARRLTTRLRAGSGSPVQRAFCERLTRLAIEESLAAIRASATAAGSVALPPGIGPLDCVSTPRQGPLP